MNTLDELVAHIEAGFPFLSVSTIGTEAERIAKALAMRLHTDKSAEHMALWFDIRRWPDLLDLARNKAVGAGPAQSENDPFSNGSTDPMESALTAIDWLVTNAENFSTLDEKENAKRVVLIMANCHRYADPAVPGSDVFCQALRNSMLPLKKEAFCVLFIGPMPPSNPVLNRLIVEIDAPLPTTEELAERAQETRRQAGMRSLTERDAAKIGRMASGMTQQEADNVFALLAAQADDDEKFDLREIARHAISIVGQTPGLSLVVPEPHETMKRLSGLDAVKKATKFALTERKHPKARPKGQIWAGVPGVGKSALGKALAQATGRKLFMWDVRESYGSLLGETEQNARQVFATVKAAAPCILMIDEAGAALSGGESSSKTDGGVTSGLIGFVQTQLQEMTEEVYVIFTVNDLSSLPGPMRRAGRFDETYWFGFPSTETVIAMFEKVWCPYYDLPFDKAELDGVVLEKWVGADVEAACRKAAMLGIDLGESVRDRLPSATMMEFDIHKYMKAANGAIDATSGRPLLFTGKELAPLPKNRRGDRATGLQEPVVR